MPSTLFPRLFVTSDDVGKPEDGARRTHVERPRMETAWAYAAVSSGRQEDTLADQLAWARAAALERGWTISREFHGVASGRDGVRRTLTALIAELRALPRAARPARILMIRIDRLGRGDGLDAIAALADIRKLGVTIFTREDGDVAITRATDALVPALRSITAALENEARSDKSRAMHARKRAAGEPVGITPYGFTLIEKRRQPFEPEAAFVREIFDLRSRGWSMGRISAHARRHAPPKRRKDGSAVAMGWATSSIIALVKNTAYRGSIVDPELFDAVQGPRKAIMSKDARNPWPLRGAVRCICGLRITGRVSGGTPKTPKTRYYVCADAAAHEGYPGHRADRVEAQFADLLGRLAAPDGLRDYAGPAPDPTPLRAKSARLTRELAAIDARRRRSWELAEEGGIEAGTLRMRLAELEAERVNVEQALRETATALRGAIAARTLAGGAQKALAAASSIWSDAPLALRQEIAILTSMLVGGLWLDPKRRAQLLAGTHGAARRKSEDVCRETPSAALLALASLIADEVMMA